MNDLLTSSWPLSRTYKTNKQKLYSTAFIASFIFLFLMQDFYANTVDNFTSNITWVS